VCYGVLQKIGSIFRQREGLGPTQPIVPRIRNKHYFEVVFKIEKNINAALKKIRTLINEHYSVWSKKGVEIIADTDAY